MTDVEKAQPEQPAAEQQDDGPPELEARSNWEFIDQIPTTEEVAALLKTLPRWWGLDPVDFADYVQGLPADKKVTVKDEQGRKVEQWRSVVTLYFSVAGRQQMLREAQEMHGWVVDFEPEPVTPSGVPGFLQLDQDRIVYREYVQIWVPVHSVEMWEKVSQAIRLPDPPPELEASPGPVQVFAEPMPPEQRRMTRWFAGQEFVRLGKRPGMAWVPYAGGKQAKGSNPYEKVETAARGRALAAWGFGVLPGSGVASLEEMLGVKENRAAMEAAAEEQQQAAAPKQTKEDLASDLLAVLEEGRQLTDRSQAQVFDTVATWFQKATGVDVVKHRGEGGEITELDLLRAKQGQLILAKSEFRKRLAQIKADLKGE